MTPIEPQVTREWATPGAAEVIELAARTCYKSEPTDESPDDFVARIAQRGHESVLEHAVFSARIVCDRGISHEVVRHRICSFSQESTRYINYTKDKHGGGDIQFLHPIDLTPEQLEFSVKAYTTIEGLYNEAIALGMTPQQARDYLPNGAKTELVMTANAREWMHFLKLRTSKAAHPKMRVVACKVGHLLAEWLPCIFKGYSNDA